MLKLLTYLVFLGAITANTVMAQSEKKFDQSELKQDQILRALSKILNRVVKLENSSTQTPKFDELELTISNLEKIVVDLKKELQDVSSDLSLKTTDLQVLQESQTFAVNMRVSEIEKVLEADRASERIVLDDDTGIAKVFKASQLGSLVSTLPLEEECAEVGAILLNYPERSYNLVFLRDMNGEIAYCKDEYGPWQILPGAPFELGHVVLDD